MIDLTTYLIFFYIVERNGVENGYDQPSTVTRLTNEFCLMFGDGIKVQGTSQITTDFRFIISTLDKDEQKWGHCETLEGFIKCLSISRGR